jgi:hypothetical protein
METIEILIGKDGSAKVEVQGCAGQKCYDLTKGIEQALGEVKADEVKPELFKQPQERQIKR